MWHKCSAKNLLKMFKDWLQAWEMPRSQTMMFVLSKHLLFKCRKVGINGNATEVVDEGKVLGYILSCPVAVVAIKYSLVPTCRDKGENRQFSVSALRLLLNQQILALAIMVKVLQLISTVLASPSLLTWSQRSKSQSFTRGLAASRVHVTTSLTITKNMAPVAQT